MKAGGGGVISGISFLRRMGEAFVQGLEIAALMQEASFLYNVNKFRFIFLHGFLFRLKWLYKQMIITLIPWPLRRNAIPKGPCFTAGAFRLGRDGLSG